VANPDTSPNPSIDRLVGNLLRSARQHAPTLSVVSRIISDEPRLQGAIAMALIDRLDDACVSPVPVALAKLMIESLRDICDELYKPVALIENPESLLHVPFNGGNSSPYPPVRLWVAARLHWFEGATLDVTATHLGVSRETVKRLLAEAGPAIDGYWLARYLPNLNRY
jgi:hypothetical protein